VLLQNTRLKRFEFCGGYIDERIFWAKTLIILARWNLDTATTAPLFRTFELYKGCLATLGLPRRALLHEKSMACFLSVRKGGNRYWQIGGVDFARKPRDKAKPVN